LGVTKLNVGCFQFNTVNGYYMQQIWHILIKERKFPETSKVAKQWSCTSYFLFLGILINYPSILINNDNIATMLGLTECDMKTCSEIMHLLHWFLKDMNQQFRFLWEWNYTSVSK